jgi:hypothetical protein
VSFNIEKNIWIPDESCSSSPIPKTFPDAAIPFARVRQQMTLYVRQKRTSENFSVPDFLDGGYMSGPDCIPLVPESCPTCSNMLTNVQFLDDGIFVLRTYYGAVLRRRLVVTCVCGHTYKWNPTDEFIHAIKDNTEGGGFDC